MSENEGGAIFKGSWVERELTEILNLYKQWSDLRLTPLLTTFQYRIIIKDRPNYF